MSSDLGHESWGRGSGSGVGRLRPDRGPKGGPEAGTGAWEWGRTGPKYRSGPNTPRPQAPQVLRCSGPESVHLFSRPRAAARDALRWGIRAGARGRGGPRAACASLGPKSSDSCALGDGSERRKGRKRTRRQRDLSEGQRRRGYARGVISPEYRKRARHGRKHKDRFRETGDMWVFPKGLCKGRGSCHWLRPEGKFVGFL